MAKTNQNQLDLFSKNVAKDDVDHWYHPRFVVIRPVHYRFTANQRITKKPVHQMLGNLNKRH